MLFVHIYSINFKQLSHGCGRLIDFMGMKFKTVKISFYLKYQTHFGQSIWVFGNHPSLGGGQPQKALPLSYLNDNFWVLELNFPFTDQKIEYHYLIREENGKELVEWGNDKILDLSLGITKDLILVDTWNFEGQVENVFYTEPFIKTLLKENKQGIVAKKIKKNNTHLFRVKAPVLQKGQTLAIIGEWPLLGNWDTQKSIPLSKIKNSPYFEIALQLDDVNFPLFYKYGIYDNNKKLFISYETGQNRILWAGAQKNKLIICNDGFASLTNHYWRGAGVAIPVFSLRSNESGGVGEFSDIKLLVNWSKKIGLSLIQLLPVNDTTANHTWSDSYPYAAISAFALHPLYLRIEELLLAKQKKLIEAFLLQKQKLNTLEQVDYEQVMHLKWKTLRVLFDHNGNNDLATEDFNDFFELNKHWLVPYSVFSYLRELHGTVNFNAWPTHSKYNEESIQKLIQPNAKSFNEIRFYYYIQYHLHKQLKSATHYANKNGIIVKGDIPIGVYRFGVDAWQHPNLFHMDRQAGAPPDDFTEKGQNWGFPTYHWQNMAATNYSWWKQRFEQMRIYFDAFRIDHILGFCRIWSIPIHAVEGIMGRFIPAHAIRQEEFINKGILFDAARFTQPYINDTILLQIFGSDNAYVKKNYCLKGEEGLYHFLPTFQTQIQVVNHFKLLPQDAWHSKIKNGLLQLLSNVILFEDDTAGSYHFRFNIEGSYSFKYLDENTKNGLRELYNDYFFVRQNNIWEQEALAKLPYLKRATNMLVCGEDLGLVPACLPTVMKQLGILSLEVQRMPKASNSVFFNPKEAPYLSVVTPSSHDTSTIRAWWEEDPNKIKQFFHEQLEQNTDPPNSCEPWIIKKIMLQHLHSPAMWSIFQLQDYLGVDVTLRTTDSRMERINDPSNANHYWRYRMHLYLENLIQSQHFNEQWKIAIKEAGR